MNFAGLQARLVPLVAELFATLASRNPLRMYFADIAGKTLLDIVQVLREDGISQEAIAASFGLTMNGYRAKMRRLQDLHHAEGEAEGEEPRTLLERVFGEVVGAAGAWLEAGPLARKFRGVKADTLNGILHFLVQSGVVEQRGRGRARAWRAVERLPSVETTALDTAVLLYREGPLTASQLASRLGLSETTVTQHLDELRAGGRLRVSRNEAGEQAWRATEFHIPLDTPAGYEAALFDHLSTVIQAICKKVRLGRHTASLGDRVGGATFTFHVPVDDPLWAEVSSNLREQRIRLEGWLARAKALSPKGPEAFAGRRVKRISIYVGQWEEELEQ